MAFEAANYEAEDVFMEADQVDLFPLEPGVGFRFRERCQRRLLWRDVTRTLASVNPDSVRSGSERNTTCFFAASKLFEMSFT